jgi:hypothetical protein
MDIIANVYDFNITQEDFECAKVHLIDCQCPDNASDKKTIDYLIDRYLLLNQAQKFGVEVTDDEWNDKLFDTAQGFDSREHYLEFLENHKLTRVRYEDFLKETIQITKFLDKFNGFIKERVAKDISSFANSNSDLFSCCPQAHVYNILLQGVTDENFKKLMKIRKDIETLEDFEKMADTYSECPAGVKCGDMGFVSADTFIEELDDVIFSLPLNEVSLPVKSKFGYHLILVTERSESNKLSNDEKKDMMLNCLIENKSELYLHSYVEELRKEAEEKGKLNIF